MCGHVKSEHPAGAMHCVCSGTGSRAAGGRWQCLHWGPLFRADFWSRPSGGNVNANSVGPAEASQMQTSLRTRTALADAGRLA